MNKVVLDTCVVIDFIQNRKPYSESAKEIFYLIADKKIEGNITANTVADIYYLTHKYTHNHVASKKIISKLLSLVDTLDVNKDDVLNALDSEINDYEDAILHESARRNKINVIVTRNIKDYKNAVIDVETPADFLKRF